MSAPLHARSDWNTCAQAAVVDTLFELRVLPSKSPANLSPAAWRESQIARVLERFPPDAPLGLGTSAYRLRAALRSHGLEVRLVHAAPFGAATLPALADVGRHVAARLPALVCVDDGLLGGSAWTAHWTRLAGLDPLRARLADGHLRREVPRESFLAAWRCRHLPWPHNACALLVERGA